MTEADSSRPESRVRLPRNRAASGVIDIANTSPLPSQPSDGLRGKFIESQGVNRNLDYLRSIAELQDKASSPGQRNWRNLLSGEIEEVSGGGVHPHTKQSIHDAGASLARGEISLGGTIDSGVDYEAMRREIPTKRYKFYHSFGDMAGSNAYLTEVVKRANERGLSLTLKTFDHAYDGVNVYTYHFNEMAEIVQAVYQEHTDAFMDTEHFLQGELPGVNANHIGWVQEPAAGAGLKDLHSHSGRMGRLGEVLDQEGFSEEAYRHGCEVAGVQPDKPWLLSEAYETRLLESAASRT